MNNEKQVPMRIIDAKKRIKNFDEVEIGYNREEAIKEASRCLNCKNPMCVKGCPVNIQIPKFIEALKNGDIELSADIISESSNLSSICGRVCPQEKQCEKLCVRGLKGEAISIGALERYVADYRLNNKKKIDKKQSNGKKVAIVGSGPSGLACAFNLIHLGYMVDVYESLHKAGGVLTYGIPEFRLPKNIVDNYIEELKSLGVNFIFNALVGSFITLDELSTMYDAVFVGTGAGLPKFANVENESANGVYSANEILTRVNLMEANMLDAKTPIKIPNVAIIVGGGNVAMDAARVIRRLGSKVIVLYRRGIDEAPARKREIEHAKEEGIIFELLSSPERIIVDDNNFVKGIEAIKMEYIDNDNKERKDVRKINGSNYVIDCDMVIMALGTTPNPVILKNSSLETKDGLIIVNNTKTNLDNVYAGGDVTTGAATVILAMEAGIKAAKEIDNNLRKV